MLKRVILVLVQLLFCRPSTPGVKLSSVTESAVAHTRVESVPATNATETVCCSTTLGPSPANTHQDGCTTSYKWLYYTIPLLLLVGILVIICVKVGKNRISRRYKTQEQRNQDTNLNKTCSNEDKVIYTQLNLQAQKNKKAQQEGIVYATVKFNE